MKTKKSWVKAMILEGQYQGRNVEVYFGKPIKIAVEGKDITDIVAGLQISLTAKGHLLYLKLVELDYSQVPPQVWENMHE